VNGVDPLGLSPGLNEHGADWAHGNLQDALKEHLGPAEDIGIEEGSTASKLVFYDYDDPDKQIVYDIPDNYYRIVRQLPSGSIEYYDRTTETWGTNKELGDEGLANSHYNNTGDSYSSLDDANEQALGYTGPYGDSELALEIEQGWFRDDADIFGGCGNGWALM
jgi:hypothetical protein